MCKTCHKTRQHNCFKAFRLQHNVLNIEHYKMLKRRTSQQGVLNKVTVTCWLVVADSTDLSSRIRRNLGKRREIPFSESTCKDKIIQNIAAQHHTRHNKPNAKYC